MSLAGFGKTSAARPGGDNDQSLVVDDGLGLYAVCDASAGLAPDICAELASRAIRQVVSERRAEPGTDDPETVRELARRAIAEVSRRIHEAATRNPNRAGMACSLTIVLVAGNHGVMAHAGSTRLYLVRNGGASQLSADHTMGHELVRDGVVPPGGASRDGLDGVLTRIVGAQEAVRAETLVFDLLAGDRLVLCTAGAVGDAAAEEIAACAAEPAGEDVVERWVGGSTGTVTVVVVDVDPELVTSTPAAAMLAALARVPFLADLPMRHKLRLVHIAEPFALEAGDPVVSVGEPVRGLHVVIDGILRVVRDGDAVELGSGGYFGDAALLGERSSDADVVSATASRVARIDGAAFMALVRRRPWLGVELLARLASSLAAR